MAQKQTIKSSPDRKLATRVRALIAKQVSHPGAIAVYVEQGTVTLGGPILASELAELRDAVTDLDGVNSVLDHLEAHETAEGVPELQNGRSALHKRSGRGRLVAGAVLGGLGLGLLATRGLARRNRKKKVAPKRDAEDVPVQGTEEGTFEPVTV